ncbi:MAG TPA: acyltransferase [Candidatus Nanoarchaeia archaeon]|nr:acyltransferase [Candidatus Nanoarchaeia archaeon]
MAYEKPIYSDFGMTQWHWLVRHRGRLKLGKNTQIAPFTVIDAMNGVEIQDNVKVGFSSVIISHSTVDGRTGPVVLKKNCKIGANTTILPNVTVGENSVVGANSLVNRDIPPNEMWFGSPARFHKKL